MGLRLVTRNATTAAWLLVLNAFALGSCSLDEHGDYKGESSGAGGGGVGGSKPDSSIAGAGNGGEAGVAYGGAAGQGGEGLGGKGGSSGSGGTAKPTCEDGQQNGNETDQDCGGGTCPACDAKRHCKANGDCLSNHCTEGECLLCGQAQEGVPKQVLSEKCQGDCKGFQEWQAGGVSSSATLSAAVSNQDHTWVQSDVGGNKNSPLLRSTDFGFHLPMTAYVTGVTLHLLRATSGNVTNHDETIKLIRNNVEAGKNLADKQSVWPEFNDFEWREYGGPDNRWEVELTASVVNSPTFGVEIVTHNYYKEAPSTAYVDAIMLEVHYCE